MLLLLTLSCLTQTPSLPVCRQEIIPAAPLFNPNRPGQGLATSGDWIAVGDPSPPFAFQGRGQVFLYEFDDETGRHVHRQTLGPTFDNDYQFGIDIALDGDTLVIGSPSFLGAPVINPGSAYVYRLVGGLWEEQERIVPDVGQDLDRFGWAVAASEGRIAISAPDRDLGSQSGLGAVFVFREDGGDWQQEAELFPSPPFSSLGDFGYDVDLDGPTLAAPFDRITMGSRVVVFERDVAANTWTEAIEIDQRAGGVAVEGDLVVSATIDTFTFQASDIRTARKDSVTGNWIEDALPPIQLNGSGRWIALQDGRLVLGAPSSSARVVQSYVVVDGAWTLDFEATPLGETPSSDFTFGERIAVSADHIVVASSSYGFGYVGRVFRYTPSCHTFGDVACFQPAPNSTNQGGELYAVGSRRVTDNNITLAAVQLPQNEMGLFLASRTSALPAVPPGSEGSVCLGGDIGRFAAPDEIRDSGPEGRFDLRLDLGAIPISTQDVVVVTGETWYFQAWYRDETSARTSNFTDAIEITWE